MAADDAPADETQGETWTEPAAPTPGMFDVISALAAHVNWHGDAASEALVTEWLDTHPDNPEHEPDGGDADDQADAPAPVKAAPGKSGSAARAARTRAGR